MTQFARPASDISAGSTWTDEGSSFNDGNLYTSLREVTADDDVSYVNSTGDSGAFEVKLTTITDPEVGTGHVVHVFAKATGSGGPERIQIELFEATTLIEEIIGNWAPGRGSYADINFTLLSANDITDYSDLRIRITIASIGGSEQMDVTQIYLETPDAPSAGGELTQINFRIRNTGDDGDSELINANGAGDWGEAININHIGIPSPKRAGICFGLRMEVEETVSSSRTWTPRLKYRKNGAGGFLDLATENHNDQRILANSREIGILPTDRFTDAVATTNILSGSAKGFVAGTGEHQSTAASNTLNNQHTEIEWRIYINKIWNGTTVGNVDGDFFDFRVYDSNTALDVYTVTPRITLEYDNDYIGGCYPESIGNFGPFIASDGDIFTFVEDSELVGNIKLLRRASGETEWTVMDQANEPSAFTDLESFHVHQVGDTLHIFYQGGETRYETVNLSTHAWGGLDEEVDAATGTNQQVSGARRSDGTTICVYVDASDDLVYKERAADNGGPGAWDVSSTNIFTGTVDGSSGVLAASDKIYFSWGQESDTTIRSRSLSSSNVLGTERTISTDARTSGAGTQWSVIAPVYWDDGGTEKVGIIYQEETDAKLYWRIISDDGAPAAASVVTDNAVTDNPEDINSRQPAASATVDGDQIYVVFSQASDFDVYYTVSDNGAAFGTDIEIQDAVIVHAVGANVYTSGGKVLAYITETAHADGSPEYSGFTGGIAYFEESIAVAGGNVVPLLQEATLGHRLMKGATL